MGSDQLMLRPAAQAGSWGDMQHPKQTIAAYKYSHIADVSYYSAVQSPVLTTVCVLFCTFLQRSRPFPAGLMHGLRSPA
jgi:hypothetical protein